NRPYSTLHCSNDRRGRFSTCPANHVPSPVILNAVKDLSSMLGILQPAEAGFRMTRSGEGF
ncbi:MAG: hypothetical protein ACOZB3_12270, partial [Calditrichota bacterium]